MDRPGWYTEVYSSSETTIYIYGLLNGSKEQVAEGGNTLNTEPQPKVSEGL